jgi:hypothetical protein
MRRLALRSVWNRVRSFFESASTRQRSRRNETLHLEIFKPKLLAACRTQQVGHIGWYCLVGSNGRNVEFYRRLVFSNTSPIYILCADKCSWWILNTFDWEKMRTTYIMWTIYLPPKLKVERVLAECLQKMDISVILFILREEGDSRLVAFYSRIVEKNLLRVEFCTSIMLTLGTFTCSREDCRLSMWPRCKRCSQYGNRYEGHLAIGR